MFIAHVPAGYILGKKLQEKLKTQYLLATALVFSFLPDLDLIWFYLVDGRAFNHHLYWVHIPFFWVVLFGLGWLLVTFLNKKYQHLKKYIAIAAGAIFTHLVLDTYVGGVAWLYPYSEQLFMLFELEAHYDWWVWNFVLHPTFLLEVVIVAVALYLFFKK